MACKPLHCSTLRQILRFQSFNDVSSSARLLSYGSCLMVKQDSSENSFATNPFYEKYADKIKKIQATTEFQVKQNLSRREKRLQQEILRWKNYHDVLEQKFKTSNQGNKACLKLPDSLSKLVKMDLCEAMFPTEISNMWREHFKSEDCVCSAIPADEYRTMAARAEANPLFLYPVPKSHGYEFFLGQFEKNRCFFTSLLNYQVHGENSPWQLCLVHYTELIDAKGIVLMASEIDLKSLNVFEAQYVAQLLKLSYGAEGQMYDLVCSLNQRPDSFKYMDIVKAIETSNMVVM